MTYIAQRLASIEAGLTAAELAAQTDEQWELLLIGLDIQSATPLQLANAVDEILEREQTCRK